MLNSLLLFVCLILCVVCKEKEKDPVNPAWLGFENLPLNFSASGLHLPVTGTIPSFLSGVLYRNGPANYENKANHWFDGLAMLHAFKFDKGTVSYTAQFVQSTAYNNTVPRDPVDRLFSHAPQWAANTVVTIDRMDGHYLSNTGFSLPNEFDPVTLATLQAPYEYSDSFPPSGVPEHRRIDRSGVLVHYFIQPSSYEIYQIFPDSTKRVPLGSVPVNPQVGEPMYAHSFGLTEHYVILSEVPCTFGNDWSEYRWLPTLGTTWHIVDRTSGAQVATFFSDAFFMMHHVNAYENEVDNTIVVDLLTYPDNSILAAAYLDTIQNRSSVFAKAFGEVQFARFVLPMSSSGSHVNPTILKSGFEFPIVNPLFAEQEYQYVFGVGMLDGSTFFDYIVKTKIVDGSELVRHRVDQFPGEPIFVPTPNSAREDDGVLLSVALDLVKGHSVLLILNATTLDDIGCVSVPNVIPFGFHGAFFTQ